MLELLNADASNREKSKSLYVAADYMLGIYYTDIDKEKAKVYLNDYLTLAPDDERIKTLLNSLDK